MKSRPCVVRLRSSRLSADVFIGVKSLYTNNPKRAKVYPTLRAAAADRAAAIRLLSGLHPDLQCEVLPASEVVPA